jgi:hypothetical protein
VVLRERDEVTRVGAVKVGMSDLDFLLPPTFLLFISFSSFLWIILITTMIWFPYPMVLDLSLNQEASWLSFYRKEKYR